MLVRKLRLQKGWSQDQLAEFSGLSVRTIQRVERGNQPGLETKKALAAVFEVTIDQLTTEADMQTNSSIQQESANITHEEAEAIEYVKGVKDFYTHLAVFFIVNICLVVLNLALTPSFYWFIYALLGWGVGLLLHWLTTFEVFNMFGPKWEKQQIEKRLGRKL